MAFFLWLGHTVSTGYGGGVFGVASRCFLLVRMVFISAFVLEPKHWNFNADDTEPLICAKNVSCVWPHLCYSWSFFCKIICNYDTSLNQSFFLFFASLFCFRSDSFARNHLFWDFRISGWNFWSHLLICRLNCISASTICSTDIFSEQKY